jgi:protein FAM50
LKQHLYTWQVRKGDSIGEFLRAVQQQLAPEFREVRTTSVENLLYVKEDLIIPHVCKAYVCYLVNCIVVYVFFYSYFNPMFVVLVTAT